MIKAGDHVILTIHNPNDATDSRQLLGAITTVNDDGTYDVWTDVGPTFEGAEEKDLRHLTMKEKTTLAPNLMYMDNRDPNDPKHTTLNLDDVDDAPLEEG